MFTVLFICMADIGGTDEMDAEMKKKKTEINNFNTKFLNPTHV